MSNNIELVRLLIERGFNQGDLSVADEVCAKELTEHAYPAPTGLSGPEILKSQIRTLRTQFPDLNLTIEDITASGDKVWVQIVTRGTDPRSGESITVREIDLCRFENGLMVEHWGIPDPFGRPSDTGGGHRLQA